MHADYEDIQNLTPLEPLWWDEYRVPRFAPFHPDMCNNIYADEAALCEVACQACKRLFLVAESWNDHQLWDVAQSYVMAGYSLDKKTTVIDKAELSKKVLEEAESRRASNYIKTHGKQAFITGGDPPFHGTWVDAERGTAEMSPKEIQEYEKYGPCSAGYCMSVDPIRVVEFWIRKGEKGREWVRKPELEVVFEEIEPTGPSSV